jgi:hypothetical protein
LAVEWVVLSAVLLIASMDKRMAGVMAVMWGMHSVD